MEELTKYLSKIRKDFPRVNHGLGRGLSLSGASAALENHAELMTDALVGLLGVVNGQRITAKGLIPSLSVEKSCTLLPADAILSVWENIPPCEIFYGAGGKPRKSNSSPEVRDAFWLKQWIPFARSTELNGKMVTYFIDYEPTSCGVLGQIVEECWHIGPEIEVFERSAVASSIASFFGSLSDMPLAWNRTEGVVLCRTKQTPNYAFKPTAGQAPGIDRRTARRGGLTRR